MLHCQATCTSTLDTTVSANIAGLAAMLCLMLVDGGMQHLQQQHQRHTMQQTLQVVTKV
jgi:hypothetical protein